MQKNNNSTILFLVLDAFRWDYCNPKDSPTLYRLGKNGIWIKKLKTSSGFTQRSTIFTGAPPDIHGNFTMYIYDPATSPYNILAPFVNFLKALSRFEIVFKIIKKIINQLPKLTANYAPPAHIPLEILPLISVTEDLKCIYEPHSLSVESLFDKFYIHGISYKYFMAPVPRGDEWAMKKILSELKYKANIYFLQFSDSDGIIHEVGSESQKRREIVNKIDERIKLLKKEFERTFENVWFIIIGDHGMMDVQEYIDIWNPVMNFAKSHKLILGKDFLMFLDSTLARFWFFNNKAREILSSFLTGILSRKGEIITEKIAKKYKIPLDKKRYGELIWRAKPGIGIFPDYFHSLKNKYKAMHGYNSDENKMKGMAIIYNKDKLPKGIEIEKGCLEDLCPTICDILKLPYPAQNQGLSFLRKIL